MFEKRYREQKLFFKKDSTTRLGKSKEEKKAKKNAYEFFQRQEAFHKFLARRLPDGVWFSGSMRDMACLPRLDYIGDSMQERGPKVLAAQWAQSTDVPENAAPWHNTAVIVGAEKAPIAYFLTSTENAQKIPGAEKLCEGDTIFGYRVEPAWRVLP